MSEVTLTVTEREGTGTGSARASRRAGNVPAVIYGGGKDSLAIEMPFNQVTKAINSGNFIASMVTLDNGGKKQKAITKDIQFHPVKDMPMHVDFFRVTESTIIEVEVPINIINEEESPGMKMGGTLNVVRYAIEVKCPAGSIPDNLDVDLTGLEIDDSIHTSDITWPEGVSSAITDRDVTILSVVGTRAAMDEDEDEAAEGEEGEVTEAGDVPATAQTSEDGE